MVDFRTESLCTSADGMTMAELRQAAARGDILQSTALACDNARQLRFQLAGWPAVMPYEECADGAAEGSVRDIAILTRVGRPTCFVIRGIHEEPGQPPVFELSRTAAQQACRTQYLDRLLPGTIIPCTVTHIEPFGAFCDVGCGISALLPIDCLSVSRIRTPADRVSVGQRLRCAVKSRDPQGRLVLTLRELLGTWNENAACFSPGETVVGIVRSIEEYGVFIEIAPNLAGLAEAGGDLVPGQAVSVYIKNILPDKMKVKLVVVNRSLGHPLRFEPRYFVEGDRLDHWVYSTPQSRKVIETCFV